MGKYGKSLAHKHMLRRTSVYLAVGGNSITRYFYETKVQQDLNDFSQV